MQSLSITTKVVSSNPGHVKHYAIKFVSDLRLVFGFSPDTLVSSTNKTDCHDITEISLKVALNTSTLAPNPKTVQSKHCIHWIKRSDWMFFEYEYKHQLYDLKAIQNYTYLSWSVSWHFFTSGIHDTPWFLYGPSPIDLDTSKDPITLPSLK